MTAPILVAGPAVEPVSLSDMTAHLRLDDGAEDALVEGLIRAARILVEERSGRMLIESRWRIDVERAPPEGVRLPRTPLLAVDGVSSLAPDGTATPLPPSAWRVAGGDPPRLVAALPPGSSLRVEWRAGFAALPAGLPEPLRLAVRLLAARWFAHRGDGEAGAVPEDVTALIAPFRPMRL